MKKAVLEKLKYKIDPILYEVLGECDFNGLTVKEEREIIENAIDFFLWRKNQILGEKYKNEITKAYGF